MHSNGLWGLWDAFVLACRALRPCRCRKIFWHAACVHPDCAASPNTIVPVVFLPPPACFSCSDVQSVAKSTLPAGSTAGPSMPGSTSFERSGTNIHSYEVCIY